jgi:hypothetical protein
LGGLGWTTGRSFHGIIHADDVDIFSSSRNATAISSSGLPVIGIPQRWLHELCAVVADPGESPRPQPIPNCDIHFSFHLPASGQKMESITEASRPHPRANFGTLARGHRTDPGIIARLSLEQLVERAQEEIKADLLPVRLDVLNAVSLNIRSSVCLARTKAVSQVSALRSTFTAPAPDHRDHRPLR